jgi:hypothetical protein
MNVPGEADLLWKSDRGRIAIDRAAVSKSAIKKAVRKP